MHRNMIGETLAYRSVFFVTSEGKQERSAELLEDRVCTE